MATALSVSVVKFVICWHKLIAEIVTKQLDSPHSREPLDKPIVA